MPAFLVGTADGLYPVEEPPCAHERLARSPTFNPSSCRLNGEPFDRRDWLFEPKYDGFRSLLYVILKGSYMRSKRGNHLRRFEQLCQWVAAKLPVREAIILERVLTEAA